MATRYQYYVQTMDFCIVQVLTHRSSKTIKKLSCFVIYSVHVAFHSRKEKFLQIETEEYSKFQSIVTYI